VAKQKFCHASQKLCFCLVAKKFAKNYFVSAFFKGWRKGPSSLKPLVKACEKCDLRSHARCAMLRNLQTGWLKNTIFAPFDRPCQTFGSVQFASNFLVKKVIKGKAY
jgi:hypothetical protein